MEKDNDLIIFECSDGTKYMMFHEQDCCEAVYIEDVCGDVDTLLGTEILLAENVSNQYNDEAKDVYDESFTWTYYKLATAKGYVTIRWYGTSNGYYSESVDFVEMEG